jgi:transaldolase
MSILSVEAVACAEAGATLISPFVGRILDWYKKSENRDYTPAEDPGVLSVTEIYNYLKYHEYKTIVMGASFRNSGEILELAGIDYLTISPKLLEELSNAEGEVECKLSASNAKAKSILKASYIDNETSFRADLEANKMAYELLHDGIKRFDEDGRKLAQYVLSHFLN